MRRILLTCVITAVLVLAFAGSRTANAAVSTQITVSYSVVGGGAFQPPVIHYTNASGPVSTPLTTTPTQYSAEYGASWSVPEFLPGSNLTQRWATANSTSGVASGQVIRLVYYRQSNVTFAIGVFGNGKSFLLPLLNYTSFGNTTSTYPNPFKSVWADYMSDYSYGKSKTSNPAARWYVTGGQGPIDGPATIRPLYIQQFLLNFTLSSTGPDHLQSTTLTANYAGGLLNRTLTPPGGAFWIDVNSSITLQPAVYSGSGGSRWFLHTLSDSKAVSPANVTAEYIEQYPVSVPFTISSGTVPSPPFLVSTIDGQETSAQLIAGAPPTWVDAGAEYSISSLLQGSTSVERWITKSNTSGVANGPVTLDLEYFHQVLVGLGYSVAGGGSIGPLYASYVTFGGQDSIEVNATQGSVWADSGTVLSVKGGFSGASFERWELGSSPSVTLENPGALPLVYYHQFEVVTTYAVSGGGSPGSPSLTGYALGVPFAFPIQSGSLVWLDSGSFWSVPGVLQGSLSGERWAAVGSANGTVGSGTSIGLTYQHEFYVALSASPAEGESLSGEGWVPIGETIQVSASVTRGLAFIDWTGIGQASYSGRNQTFSVSVSSPIEETANYYVSLTIKVIGKGTVLVTYGASSLSVGNQLTIYVPPGTNITLNAKPGALESFTGWVGIPAGNVGAVLITAASPAVATAVFGINEVEALGVVVLCFGGATYLIAYLIWKGLVSPARLRNALNRSVKTHG